MAEEIKDSKFNRRELGKHVLAGLAGIGLASMVTNAAEATMDKNKLQVEREDFSCEGRITGLVCQKRTHRAHNGLAFVIDDKYCFGSPNLYELGYSFIARGLLK